MRLPFILDVALGLIFIYLIFSLLASEIQELIATIMQWRAAHLKKSIEIFLSGSAHDSELPEVVELVTKIYGNPLIKSINQEAKGFFATLPRKFTWMMGKISNKLGNSMAKSSVTRKTFAHGNSGPSYIAADTFATSLIEELKLTTIVHNLTESRLSSVKTQHIQEIRIILTRSLKQVQAHELPTNVTQDIQDDFETLQKEYDLIFIDFKEQRFDIDTSVGRMKDSMGKYINNFQANMEVESYVLRETCKRLSAFYYHIFPSVEEAIVIGGLKPNISEITGILETGSSVYNSLEISISSSEDHTYKAIHEVVEGLPPIIRKNIFSIAKQAKYKAKSTEEGIRILRTEIEQCFDNSMARAGGVYKRNAKGVAILIGIALAFGANADTFHIIDRLSKDTVLREAIVYKAEQTIERQPNAADIQNIDTKEILEDLQLPIGWTDNNLQEQLGWHPTKIQNIPIISILTMFTGWIISGLAIAMGAPFWFDLLSKVMKVKNAGSSSKR
ncbi:MAG: hypothetical protein F6K61_04495 [Sphaerospermopsis sp. SIO1G1]|nr:hypothetical protein [Sphaerospermopsis sp. SIO1G1]